MRQWFLRKRKMWLILLISILAPGAVRAGENPASLQHIRQASFPEKISGRLIVVEKEWPEQAQQPTLATEGAELQAPLLFDLRQIRTLSERPIRLYAEWEKKSRLILGLAGYQPGVQTLLEFAKRYKQHFRQPALEVLLDQNHAGEYQQQPLLEALADFPVRFVTNPYFLKSMQGSYLFNRDLFPLSIVQDDGQPFLVASDFSTWDMAAYCRVADCPRLPDRKPAVIRMPQYMVGGELLSDGNHLCAVGDTVFNKLFRLHQVRAYKAASLFKQYFGCEKLIVLRSNTNKHVGMTGVWFGDGTEHIDMIMKFLPQGRIVLARVDDPQDPYFASNRANLDFISSLHRQGLLHSRWSTMPMVSVVAPLSLSDRGGASQKQGSLFAVARNSLKSLLHRPLSSFLFSEAHAGIGGLVVTPDDGTWPAGLLRYYTVYLNAYLIDRQSVLVPQLHPPWKEAKYDFPALNEQALKAYRDLGFAKVIGVEATSLWLSDGAIHCLTSEMFESASSAKPNARGDRAVFRPVAK